MVSNSIICLRCFQYDHHRKDCTNHPVVSCSKCYSLNFLTRNCCELKFKPDDEYFQSFRMIGEEHTQYFTDIPIGNKMVSALIDTNRSTTEIDWAVFNKLYTEKSWRSFDYKFYALGYVTCVLNVPKPHKSQLRCDVALLKNDLKIILGIDFLSQRHVVLKLDGTTLIPTVSERISRFPSARYTIELTVATGKFIGIIDTSSTQSLMDLSVLNWLRRHDKTYSYDPETRSCITTFTWNEKEVRMAFKVKRIGKNKLELGTDCLMNFQFEFMLDGISLNIQNPWKTTHQDAVQFAYNHENGKKLVLVLRGSKTPRYEDTKRPTLKLPDLIKEKLD